MKKQHAFKMLLLAGILPMSLSTVANDDVTTNEEQKVIDLVNDTDVDEKTLTVPVTATVSNSVLNVNFTGTVPVASVTVTNLNRFHGQPKHVRYGRNSLHRTGFYGYVCGICYR